MTTKNTKPTREQLESMTMWQVWQYIANVNKNKWVRYYASATMTEAELIELILSDGAAPRKSAIELAIWNEA